MKRGTAMFDSSLIAIQSSGLMRNPIDRTNLRLLALHFAEIIANDGIGHFFDESDALYLCQCILASVEALETRCQTREKS